MSGSSRSLAALVVVAAAAMAVTAHAAAPVSIPVPAQPDALTYAAGHVLWVTHTTHGPIVVHEASVAGGPATTLATIARRHPASPDVGVSLAANATGYVLAARDGKRVGTGECGCDFDMSQGELVVRGGYDGSVQPVLACTPNPSQAEEVELQVVAGSSGFALGGARCGTPSPVETIAADGTVTPIAGVTLPVPDADPNFGLAYAEPALAVETSNANHAVVRVLDLAHGTHRDLTMGMNQSGQDIDVLPDGTVVIGPLGFAGQPNDITLWGPAAAAPTVLSSLALSPLGTFAAGSGRVLMAQKGGTVLGQQALALVGLDGTGPTAVGAPGAGDPREPIALDGTTAALRSVSCAGVSQVTVVDVTMPPSGTAGCPVTFATHTVTFDRHRHATVSVTCPNGCTGSFALEIDLGAHQVHGAELNRYVDKALDSRVAIGHLDVPAGSTQHRQQLTLRTLAVAILRRHPHLKVDFDVQRIDADDGPQLAGPAAAIAQR